MDRLRMRTTLLIPLLILSFGCTVISLLVIRRIVQQQTQTNLASDLQHSVKTYRNLQHQQRELLARESALLADLPSLKSLMTTYDQRTIEDGGVEFWQVSGSDFFALLDQKGSLIVAYNRGPARRSMELFSALSPLDIRSMNMLRERSAKPLRQRLLLLSMVE